MKNRVFTEMWSENVPVKSGNKPLLSTLVFIQRNCLTGEIGMKLRITSSFFQIRCCTVPKYVYCSKSYNQWKTSEIL